MRDYKMVQSPGDTSRSDLVAQTRFTQALDRDVLEIGHAGITPGMALRLHVLGARCENAFVSFLSSRGCKPTWHDIVDGSVKSLRSLPDISLSQLEIDVKGVELHRHGLISPANRLVRHWAYVLVSAEEHPWYVCKGWCWGHELETVGITEPQPGRRAYLMRNNNPLLKDCEELCVLAKVREVA